VIIAGTEIPSEEDLRNRGYDPWGNQNYTQLLIKWSDGKCLGNPTGELCGTLAALGWVSPTQDFLEFIGVRDAIKCAKGSVSACVWTAVGFLPIGRLAKAAKLTKWGDNLAARAMAVCKKSNSFLPGTRVLLADGTVKEIQDLKVGDEVLATDPETGKTTPQEITAEILGEGVRDLVRIAVKDALGNWEPVTATKNHPFWVPSLGEWVAAGELHSGQWLRTSAGTLVQVASVRRWTQTARVYNLTVADAHTYYVLAGKTPVLVHNANCVDAMLDDASEAYVRGKHMPGGRQVTSDKSVFNSDVDLDDLVDNANRCKCHGPNVNGNFERDVNAGTVIGRLSDDAGGLPTTWYRVVQDKYGGVITMHPIPKPAVPR
jgi:hypothetical protein